MRVFEENWFAAGCLSSILLLVPLLPGPMGFHILYPITLVSPLPVLLVGLHQGPRMALLASLIPLGVAFLLWQDPGVCGFIFLMFLAFPQLGVAMLRQGLGISHVVAVGFMLAAGGLVLLFLLLGLLGVDPAANIAGVIDLYEKELVAQFNKIEGIDALTRQQQIEALSQLADTISRILPALVLVSWFVVQTINLLFLRLLDRRHKEAPHILPEDLAALRLPFLLVWWVLGLGAGAWLLEGNPGYLCLNLALFGLVPFFFQGLAVVQTYFERRGVAFFFRGAFYALLMVLGAPLVATVAMVGLFDNWIDFRNRFIPVQEENNSSGR